MDKELQNLLDNYEQVIYGYAEPIIPSIHQIHLLLDYISQLGIKVKKQKEVIDKITSRLEYYLIGNLKYQSAQEEFVKLLDILKEVSE